MRSLFSQYRLGMLLSCFLLNTLNSCYFSSTTDLVDIVENRGFEVEVYTSTRLGVAEDFQYTAHDLTEMFADSFDSWVEHGVADESARAGVSNIAVLVFDDLDEFLYFCGSDRQDDTENGAILGCACSHQWCRTSKNVGRNGTFGIRPGTGMNSDVGRTLRHELFHRTLHEMGGDYASNHEHGHPAWRELELL